MAKYIVITYILIVAFGLFIYWAKGPIIPMCPCGYIPISGGDRYTCIQFAYCEKKK